MAPGNALTPQLIALCPGNAVRRYGFRLPAHAESVGRARQLTRDRLDHWDLDEQTRETAVLVVSELVTNAIVHAAGARVLCELREGEGHLRIAVEDQGYGPTGPQLHHTGVDECEGEGGRGLFLVDSLCSGWGAHDTSGYGPGRVVWAELPHTGRAAGTGVGSPRTPVTGAARETNGAAPVATGVPRGSGTPC
ncbi:ATP-binding protein [Streptomyces corynorhini]|uniref:ATP-binding protein n=1 Tax=Streptomyces corynorhini TaxID=2282652 RepID=A0A370AS87_9ACTN|nr:ATP-binding protein [Streptomyces corynorhini]